MEGAVKNVDFIFRIVIVQADFKEPPTGPVD